jgi:hypothetical protein
MQLSPTSYHFIPSGPNIFLSTLFSNALSLCSSLNVRDQVSHPYRTRGKIIVLGLKAHCKKKETVCYDMLHRDSGFGGILWNDLIKRKWT